MQKFIEFIKNLPEHVIIVAVWLILGPAAVMLYNWLWQLTGSQKISYISLGPLALSISALCGFFLWLHYKDKN